MIFETQQYNQYLLVVLSIIALISIKSLLVYRSYKQKLDTFIHPQRLLDDIKNSIPTADDAKQLLKYNLQKVYNDPQRLRNIAILIAHCQKNKISIKPMYNQLKSKINEIQGKGIRLAQKNYKEYVLDKIDHIF